MPLIKFIEPQSKSNRIDFNKLSRQMGGSYASNKEQMLLFHITDSLVNFMFSSEKLRTIR